MFTFSQAPPIWWHLKKSSGIQNMCKDGLDSLNWNVTISPQCMKGTFLPNVMRLWVMWVQWVEWVMLLEMPFIVFCMTFTVNFFRHPLFVFNDLAQYCIFTSTRPLWTVRKWYLNKGFKGNLIFKDFYFSHHCSQNGIASSFYSFFYIQMIFNISIYICVVSFPFLVCLWCSSKICNDFHQRKHRGLYLL